MILKVSDIADKVRLALGDATLDISDDFLLAAFNYAISDLPMIPKLEKLFSKHIQANLDAHNHYRWDLNDGFRRVTDVPMLNFYTSTGGEPCRLPLCHRSVVDFYDRNGLVNLKNPGTPCEYTIETEGDNVWLVLDRPSDVPIIVDYIAYGYPKPATSLEDEYEISNIAEPLIVDTIRACWFQESSDFAFSSDIKQYLDNKKIIEAVQQLHRQWGNESPRVLGEV